MRVEDTTNFTEHRAHLRDHLRHVKETGRPMFIMDQSGEPEAVVMDARTFDRLTEEAELARRLDALDSAVADASADRGKDFRGAIHRIADGLGR